MWVQGRASFSIPEEELTEMEELDVQWEADCLAGRFTSTALSLHLSPDDSPTCTVRLNYDGTVFGPYTTQRPQ